MKATGISVLGVLGVIYDQISKKGLFALLRFHNDGNSVQFQTHFDWDDSEYAGVVEHAKMVKKAKLDKEINKTKESDSDD